MKAKPPGPRSLDRALAVMLLVFPACRAFPEPEPSRAPPPSQTPVSGLFFSTTQRFAASGFSSRDKLNLLTWTEDVAERVESAVGLRLPYRRNHPLLLLADPEAPDTLPARAIVRQRSDGKRLWQELVLTHPGRLTPEEILESLCRCMLNAMAFQLEPSAPRIAPEMPAWLYTGLAQDLYPALKARNRRSVLKSWPGTSGVDLETLTSWVYLPSGFWPEKAYCGILFDWLRSARKGHPSIPGALLVRAVREPGLGVEDLVAVLPEASDRLALEQEWDLWIASLQYRRYEFGTVEEEDLVRLRDLVTLRSSIWAALAEQPPGTRLSLDMLASERGQAWTAELAGHLALQLKQLSIGRSGAFQECIGYYREYLHSIRASAVPGRVGEPADPAATIRLRKSLAEARARHRQLEQTMLRRTERIRKAEQDLEQAPSARADAMEEAVTRMLDRAEAALEAPDPAAP